MKKILLIILALATSITAQTRTYYTGDNLYLIDSDGDTLGVFRDTNLFEIWVNTQLKDTVNANIDLLFDGNANISTVLGDEGIIRYMRTLKQLRLMTKGTEAARIDSAQRVGIGVAPTNLFHVRGSAGASEGIRFDASTGSGYVTLTADSQGDPILTMADATGAIKNVFYSDAAESYFSGNLGIGTDNPSQKLEVNGYVERFEVTDWDAIAWFPPADSGAVLDTLDNIIEVLQFYHNTDSVYVYNSWTAPPYFTDIDSVWIWVEAPNADGDSSAFSLSVRAVGLGEAADGAFTLVGADTIDLGESDRSLRRLTITGTFGVVANDVVDFELKRDNSIDDNVGAAVPLRRTRIFWR